MEEKQDAQNISYLSGLLLYGKTTCSKFESLFIRLSRVCRAEAEIKGAALFNFYKNSFNFTILAIFQQGLIGDERKKNVIIFLTFSS